MTNTTQPNVTVLPMSPLRNKQKHIDDVQTATVDEHFDLLFEGRSVVDPEPSEVGLKDLPEWFDEKLFEEGQKYYQRNMLGMGLSALIGLLAVIVVPTILKVLVWSKQSGTPCAAFKRYTETVLHTHALYTSDIKSKNSEYERIL